MLKALGFSLRNTLASSTPANMTVEAEGRTPSGESQEPHTTALDGVVSVNSFFSVAVFLGITLTPVNMHLGPVTPHHECVSGPDTFKSLIMFEIIAFSCFQFSTLVAHGLKLSLVFKKSKKANRPIGIHVLRIGLLGSGFGSVVGTFFIMLALIDYTQLRFGRIICAGPWLLRTLVPLVTLVTSGIIIFISSILYGFTSTYERITIDDPESGSRSVLMHSRR